MTAVSALAPVHQPFVLEQARVPVPEHHQRRGGRRRAAPGVPVVARPPGAGDLGAVARLAAGPQRPDAGVRPVVDVVHLRAPARGAGRYRRRAEAAAGRPRLPAVERAVQPHLVARPAALDRAPAHDVGVRDVESERPAVDRRRDRDPVARRGTGVAGVAVDVADLGGCGGADGRGGVVRRRPDRGGGRRSGVRLGRGSGRQRHGQQAGGGDRRGDTHGPTPGSGAGKSPGASGRAVRGHL